MHQRDALNHLRAAKSAHIQWRSNAQALVAGVAIDESKIPVDHTDCKFGQWYYGDGQLLMPLQAFQGIEVPHQNLHLVYKKIYDLLHVKMGFFRTQKAEKLLPTIIQLSESLIKSVELLEEDIRSHSEDEFQTLIRNP